MKKALFVIALMTGVALAWAAPPDRLPSLLTPPAEARTIAILVGSVPSNPCATNYSAVTQSSSDSTWANIYNSVVIGQSFTVPASRKLYSITVYSTTGEYGAAPNPDIRVSSSADLSSGYLAEETGINMATTGAVEIVFDPQPDLSTGTTYYFGLLETGASYSNDRYGLDHQNGDVYANGIMYVSGTGNGWDMTSQGVAGRELKFLIKLCGDAP